MKRVCWCAAGFLASLLSGAAAQTPPGTVPATTSISSRDTAPAKARLLNFDARSKIPGAFYVQFKADAALEQISLDRRFELSVLPGTLPLSGEDVEALSFALAASVDGIDVSPFSGKRRGFSVAGATEEKVIRDLANDPRIEYIEPVMSLELATTQSLPSNNSLWHLDRIDQRQLPLDRQYSYHTTATTTTVHVIDTGIRASHVEFGNRPPIQVTHCYSHLSTALPTCIPNFTTNVNLMDCNSHGTRVASLVGGTTVGVAKQVRLRGYVVTRGAAPIGSGGSWTCTQGAGDTNDLVRGIEAAIAASASDGGPSIINIAISNRDGNATVDARVQDAIAANITVVAAAGNEVENACLNSPQRVPDAITVAASTVIDGRHDFTNFGNCVDLFAPGDDILAAGIQNDSYYDTFDGSSNSAPLVAGIAALYLEDNELHTPFQVTDAILGNATTGVLQGNLGCASPPTGNCSPNRLAYSLLAGPPGGVLQFSAPSYAVSETATTVTLTATRTGILTGAVTVPYQTLNGEAVAGSDYSAASGVLSWADGDGAPKNVVIALLDDSIYEGTEHFFVQLGSPTGGAVLGLTAQPAVAINDNELPPGSIAFVASEYSIGETAGSVTLTARRSGGTGGSVGVTYSTFNGTASAGSDYNATGGILTWANGDAVDKSFAIPILDDSAMEPDETIVAALSNPTGGAAVSTPSTATVNIVDSDTALPSVPTNLRTSPVNQSYGGIFSVHWNTSTGAVHHYTLHEARTIIQLGTTITTYITTPPTTSIQFQKGGSEKTFEYKVKACATPSETQCSAYSQPPVTIAVCPMNPCP